MTVPMHHIEFRQVMVVGDAVSFRTSVERISRALVTLYIAVETERKRETVQVTQASAKFVCHS